MFQNRMKNRGIKVLLIVGILMTLFSISSFSSVPMPSDVYSKIYKQVAPAVVEISATVKIPNPFFNNNNNDPFFKFFFDQNMEKQLQKKEFEVPYLGSGVVVKINNELYVITNHHVVDNMTNEQIKIVIDENKTLEKNDIEFIRSDKLTDVAIIKLKTKDLPYAELGDSEGLEPGNIVLAIGNPLGLTRTLSVGVVSAVHRRAYIVDIEDLIQTDAMINPGNSGGALINLEGKVIGINMAIASNTGRWQGVGFAVPINLVKKVMTSLIEKGAVSRGFIGVLIENVPPEQIKWLKDNFKFDRDKAVIVGKITEGLPAQKAGLERNDVILEIDGKKMDETSDVVNYITGIQPGNTIKIKIFRKGEIKDFSIKVADRSEYKEEEETVFETMEGNILGMKLESLSPKEKEQLKIDTDAGVKVVDVKQGSPAYNAGIREGDVIVEVNLEKVKTAKDVEERVKKTPKGKDNAFSVYRNGRIIFVPVPSE